MSRSKREPFRPKLSIRRSAYAAGHGHDYQFFGTIGGPSGGLGCTSCVSLAEAMKKYWNWIEALNYPILDRNGDRYRPSERTEAQ